MHFSARAAILCGAILLGGTLQAQRVPPPTLSDVLKSVADYLERYAGDLGGVAAEEQYRQLDTGGGQVLATRRIESDMVFLGLADGAILAFRDAFAMDTNPLRPRSDRLVALFQTSPASSMTDAHRLSEDSVRHYISANISSIDEPNIALEYLRATRQARSVFKLESVKTDKGARVAVVKFTERQETTRVVPSIDKAPGFGRAWVDVASGAITRTELTFSSSWFNLRVQVRYAKDPGLGIWLPAEMTQQADISFKEASSMSQATRVTPYNTRMSLEGRATYSKYRRVAIDLSKIR